MEMPNRFDITDLLVLVALGFIFYGVWQLVPAWAWIVDGAIMLILAILRAVYRVRSA